MDTGTIFGIVLCVAVLGGSVLLIIKDKKQKYKSNNRKSGNSRDGNRPANEPGAEEPPGWCELEAEIEGLLAIWRQTAIPSIRLTPVRRKTGVFDSKLGGIPYLPPGFDYPYNTSPKSDGRPLRLLAQLNFAELPRLEGYPSEGILQVYIASEKKDDTYGLDFQDQYEQDGWRVVYHKNILADESSLAKPPELDTGKKTTFPFKGEFGLAAELEMQPMTASDHRYEEFVKDKIEPAGLYKSLVEKYGEDDVGDMFWENTSDTSFSLTVKSGEKVADAKMLKHTYGAGFRIGGYPTFIQEDPHPEGYTKLLLQLDSLWNMRETEIMFGDAGLANWFIKPEALLNADFSDIFYNWDCS